MTCAGLVHIKENFTHSSKWSPDYTCGKGLMQDDSIRMWLK